MNICCIANYLYYVIALLIVHLKLMNIQVTVRIRIYYEQNQSIAEPRAAFNLMRERWRLMSDHCVFTSPPTHAMHVWAVT